jgi:hypothetical protein
MGRSLPTQKTAVFILAAVKEGGKEMALIRAPREPTGRSLPSVATQKAATFVLAAVRT